MKRYLDLIPISAKRHRRQSLMTRLCIFLAVFLVTAIFGMADMELRSQRQQAIMDGGNWHIAFRDITEEQAARIAAWPEVKTSSWYGVVNYDCDEGYTLSGIKTAICGADPAWMGMFPAVQVEEGSFDAEGSGVLLTENARARLEVQVDDFIQLYTPDGRVLDLQVTGFVTNTAMLDHEDAFGLVMNTQTFRSYFSGDTAQDADSVYYVQFSPLCRILQVVESIKTELHLTDAQVFPYGKLLGLMGQSDDPLMLRLYLTAAVLAVLVATAGILMIASSLNSNIAQRISFFGLLRCLGATRKQVARFVRLEALNWCKTAIPLGLAAGTALVWVLCSLLVKLSPTYFAGMPAFGISGIGLTCGVVIGLVTVLLAARAPAKRAAKVSPLCAVSGNATPVSPVRRAANTRLFRVDTALGVRHATASKKNFFLMVSSFAFSIILFLAFNMAIDFMHQSITPLRPYSADLSIISADQTCSIPPELGQHLAEDPVVKRVYGRMFAYGIPATIDGQEGTVDLISYEINQFGWASGSLLEGSIDGALNGNGLLALYGNGTTRHTGSTVTADFGTGTQTLTVSGVLSDCPFQSEPGVEIFICSEETFRTLTGQDGYTILDLQLNADATDADVEAIRTQVGSGTTFSDDRRSNSEAIGAYYSFALFVYGFLAVIALIAVFNIVNSISMSVSARVRQYGAMRAIGMSSHQLMRMVAAEAATYSLFGILVGCAVGLLANWFLFRITVTANWGIPWYIPWAALGLIVLLVAFSAALAVRGPSQRIRRMSIVETIHAE